MKKEVTILCGLMFAVIALNSNAQIVSIPDLNFKAALITAGIDTSGDGEISYAEAALITSLNVNSKSIADLTGIQAFVNLTDLNCYSNQLTSLDMSSNHALKYLTCSSNHLTSLIVTGNTALATLNCVFNNLTSLNVDGDTALSNLNFYGNQIASINLSTNTALYYLWCGSNQLTSINLSANISLGLLDCNSNPLTSLDLSHNHDMYALTCPWCQLTSLDLSNNTALTYLNCQSNPIATLDLTHNSLLTYIGLMQMPTLTTVCIWTLPFPPTGVTVDITDSPNVVYLDNCVTSVKDNISQSIKVYPNPTTGLFYVECPEKQNIKMEVNNLIGECIVQKKLNNNKNEMDFSILPTGMYIIKITGADWSVQKKIIKE